MLSRFGKLRRQLMQWRRLRDDVVREMEAELVRECDRALAVREFEEALTNASSKAKSPIFSRGVKNARDRLIGRARRHANAGHGGDGGGRGDVEIERRGALLLRRRRRREQTGV